MTRYPYISVIIPVYNVAPYLRRCVDSLLAQTSRNFELVLIDDGSTDGSAAICDDYARNHPPLPSEEGAGLAPQIRVIHQPNAGVSAARNRGIVEAQGEYISFVDADDWVEPSFLQAFTTATEHHPGVDMVVQGFKEENEEFSYPQSYFQTAEEIGLHINEIEKKKLIGYVWNKLFKRSIIINHNVEFNREVTIGEDFLFSMTFISHCNSMSVVPFSGYHYFCPVDVNKTYPFSSWNKRLDSMVDIVSRMESMPQEMVRQFMAREFKMSLHVLRVAYHELIPRSERKRFIAKTKQKGKDNEFVHISQYELPFKVLAVLTLYIPFPVADQMLIITRKLRNVL